MKNNVGILLIAVSLLSLVAKGQDKGIKADTLASKLMAAVNSTDSLTEADLRKAEASVQQINKKIDSLHSLRLPTGIYEKQLDSISNSLQTRLSYHRKLDSTYRALQNRLDFPKKADQVGNVLNNKVRKVSQSQDSIRMRLSERSKALQQQIRQKRSFMDSLNLKIEDPITGKISGYSLNGVGPNLNPKLPGITPGVLTVPKNSISGSEQIKLPQGQGIGLPDLKSSNPNLSKPGLPDHQIKNSGIQQEINGVQNDMGKVKSASQEIRTSQKDIKNLRQRKLDSVATISKEAERAVSNRDEIKALNKDEAVVKNTRNALEQYKDMMASLNTKDLDDRAKLMAKGELKDEFAGQEAKLQSGISELNRLKKKYGQIPDSRYLPKRAPNLMKGKPFRERFVPGMNFMIFRNDLFVVDLMPFAVYKLTSRWRMGIGGTYRINFDDHKNQTIGNRSAYGVRGMVDYQFFRGLSAHGEFESINFNPYDPSNLKSLDYVHREWISGAYLGVLKSYRISRQWVGNFQVLYNFLYERNGLYNSKVNIRFGFEFDVSGKKPKFVPARN